MTVKFASGLILNNDKQFQIILGCPSCHSTGILMTLNVNNKLCPIDCPNIINPDGFYPVNKYPKPDFGSSISAINNTGSLYVSAPGADGEDSNGGVYKIGLTENGKAYDYSFFPFMNHRELCNCNLTAFGQQTVVFASLIPGKTIIGVTNSHSVILPTVIISFFIYNNEYKTAEEAFISESPQRCISIYPPSKYCSLTTNPLSLSNLGGNNTIRYFALGCPTESTEGYVLFYSVTTDMNISLIYIYQGPTLMPSFGYYMTGVQNNFNDTLYNETFPNLYVSAVDITGQSSYIYGLYFNKTHVTRFIELLQLNNSQDGAILSHYLVNKTSIYLLLGSSNQVSLYLLEMEYDKSVSYVILGATIGCMFYSLIFFSSMLLVQYKKNKVISIPRTSASFVYIYILFIFLVDW